MTIGCADCYFRGFPALVVLLRLRWACVPDRMSVSWRASEFARCRVAVFSMAMISVAAIMANSLL